MPSSAVPQRSSAGPVRDDAIGLSLLVVIRTSGRNAIDESITRRGPACEAWLRQGTTQ
jgi:hypothetical protein